MLAGCAVGPDYQPTSADLPERFDNDADDATQATELPSDQLFRSLGEADLSRLIDLAIANNTTVRQALATMNETRALSGLSVYSLFPTVEFSGDVERNQASPGDPFAFPNAAVVERYRAGFDATWEIDFFGSLRRQSRGHSLSGRGG